MTWLTPLTGLLLALATIPPLVALYFLKLRRSPRPIGSTLLWKRSLEDMRANAPFQRLRMNLLLLLQFIVLALLAFALAQPQVEGGLRAGVRTVILIDNSASMNATDAGGAESPRTRLELAKEEAIRKVEKLFGGGLFAGGTGEVMVIAFADRAEVRAPFSDSRAQVVEAIRSIEPTDGRTRIGEALALARAFTTSLSNPEGGRSEVELVEPADLELFSDGRIEDLAEQALRPGENLRYNRIGSPEARNVGIAAVAAERSPESPDRIQVFAAISNSNAEEARVDVQLSVDAVARAITPQPVAVPAASVDGAGRYAPGREQVVFLPFAQPRDAIIEVAQLVSDDLRVDDAAALVVPPAKRLKVALVDEEGFVLRMLLEGMALEQLAFLSRADFEAIMQGADGGIDRFDVYVLVGYTPPEGVRLPPGRYLTFGGDPVPGLNPYGEHQRLLVRTSRDEHPIFRFVVLDDLFVATAQALAPSREFERLAEASEGPLILGLDRGGVRLLHVAFDPMDSNWPVLRSIATFVPNALEWLGAAGEALALAGLEPGDTASFRVPGQASDFRLRHPDGREEAIAPRDAGQFVYGPLRRAGVYLLSWNEPGQASRGERRFAVNLLSAAESRIQPAEELLLGERTVVGSDVRGASRASLWPWLVGAALLLLLLEWWVYQRRS